MPFSPNGGKRQLFLFIQQLFIFTLFVFALLIGNAAGGFAGRLAGGLALAAAAVLHALLQVARLNGNNSLHILTLPDQFSPNKLS